MAFHHWWPAEGPQEEPHASASEAGSIDIDAEMAMAATLAAIDNEAAAQMAAAAAATAASAEALSSASALNSLWARAVADAQLGLRPPAPVRFPWERGFAAAVFGTSPRITNKILEAERPPAPAAPVAAEDLPVVPKEPWEMMGLSGASLKDMSAAWPVAAHRVSSLNWAEHEDTKRQVALARWKLILCENIGASAVGRMLVRDHLSLQTQDMVSNTLKDIFAKKSTATLAKRAASIGNYVLHCKRNDLRPFPIQEAHVYQYLIQCQHQGAAPTMPQSFREALNFLYGLLQTDGASECAASPRIAGLCFGQLLKKRPLQPRSPLTTVQVKLLEKLSYTAEFLPDRVMAGHALFNLYARCRWSDSMSMTSLVFDHDGHGGGFIEGKTLSTKTSTSAQKKTTFLPITCPMFSLTGLPWWVPWAQARLDCGLVFGPDRPVLPCISPSGTFGSIPMGADDGGAWVVELLRRGGSTASEVVHVGSHSLKITLLSWCAKFGVPREARQILGYHIVKGTESALHYSRDEQAEPLRLMMEMLTAIRDLSFFPDNSRSGYKKLKAMPPDLPEDPQFMVDELAIVQAEVANSSTDDGEQSDAVVGDAEEQVDDDEWAEASSQAARPVKAAKAVGSVMYRHMRLKTIHFNHISDVQKLACGRERHDGYERYEGSLSFPWPRCTTCFGRAMERAAQEDADVANA